jgi:hypothetical protein
MKAFLWPGEVGKAVGVSGKTISRLADAGTNHFASTTLAPQSRDGRGR